MDPFWIGNSDYFDTDIADAHHLDFNEKTKKLEIVEEFFSGVISELYGSNEINPEKLEWLLDELAYQLDLKLPEGKLKIMRRSDDLS